MDAEEQTVARDDLILVTGAAGFIGTRVVQFLLEQGFCNLRCFVRASSNVAGINDAIVQHRDTAKVETIKGNLLSNDDCLNATAGAKLIYHLAAGTGDKSFANSFLNSAVATRNLLEATLRHRCLKRLVSISSFAVYTNRENPRGRLLDENCPVEEHPELRGDAYCFAKLNQDKIVVEYGKKHQVPYVLLRPGVVYGPGRRGLPPGRVGVGTFGIFLHLAGSNPVPFTYVDNCADAIILAGLTKGIEGQVFNIVDDDLPSSRQFLRLYKRNAQPIRSIYLPRLVSYLLCCFWEKYSMWSQGQLPPVYTRRTWHAYWKGSKYTNEKLKTLCGWMPRVSTADGLQRYFEGFREAQEHA